MFDEVDAIHLDHVYLSPKFDLFHLLTPDDGAYITLRDRHDPIRDTVTARCKHLLLLGQYLPDHPSLLVVLLRELDVDPVPVFDLVLFLNKLVQQIQQAPGPLCGLFPWLLAHTHIGKILLLLFQVLRSGCRNFQMLAGSLHLTVHPINTLP